MKKINLSKIFIRIGIAMIVPALFSSFIVMMGAKEYSSKVPCEQIRTMNNDFVFYGSMIGLFSFAFVLTAIMSLSKYVDRLHELDTVFDEYLTAKQEMETARDKYTDQLIKS